MPARFLDNDDGNRRLPNFHNFASFPGPTNLLRLTLGKHCRHRIIICLCSKSLFNTGTRVWNQNYLPMLTSEHYGVIISITAVGLFILPQNAVRTAIKLTYLPVIQLEAALIRAFQGEASCVTNAALRVSANWNVRACTTTLKHRCQPTRVGIRTNIIQVIEIPALWTTARLYQVLVNQYWECARDG